MTVAIPSDPRLVEVKYCKHCDTTKPVTEFMMHKQRTNTGHLCEYRDSRCRPCQRKAQMERYYAKKRGELPRPAGRPREFWRPTAAEVACNRAFEAWRGPVTAGLGARL